MSIVRRVNLDTSNVTKLVQIGSNLSKLDKTCQNWIKLVQHGSNLIKLIQTCPYWFKLVQIGSNLSKLDQTCPNWIKLDQNGSNLSKLDQTFPNWIILVQIMKINRILMIELSCLLCCFSMLSYIKALLLVNFYTKIKDYFRVCNNSCLLQ